MRNREQSNYNREEDVSGGEDNVESKIEVGDLLRDIKERGYKFFDVEKIKEDLSERGIENQDIEVATDLMSCMAGLDDGTGAKGDVTLEFSVAENEFGDVAGFSESKKDVADTYVVYAKGITDNILKTVSKIPEMDFDGNPVANYDSWEKPTLEEILVSVASHEVRHRLQRHELSMIRPEDVGDMEDSPLKGIVEYVGLLFEEERRQYEEEERSEEYIDHKTNSLEFDARVIEIMILINLHSGADREELQRLLKLQVDHKN